MKEQQFTKNIISFDDAQNRTSAAFQPLQPSLSTYDPPLHTAHAARAPREQIIEGKPTVHLERKNDSNWPFPVKEL